MTTTWKVGEAVEIFSSSTNSFNRGEIFEISLKHNFIRVHYWVNDNLRRKKLVINSCHIRKTREKYPLRNEWCKNTAVQVWSESNKKWFDAQIIDIKNDLFVTQWTVNQKFKMTKMLEKESLFIRHFMKIGHENGNNRFTLIFYSPQKLDVKRLHANFLPTLILHSFYIAQTNAIKGEADFSISNNHILEFEYWLTNILKLPQYLSTFSSLKYNDIRLLQDINKKILLKLGIKKELHIKLFIRNINELKNGIKIFDKFLKNNKLFKYKLYLNNSLGIVTLDSLIRLLVKIKDNCFVIINNFDYTNGIPEKKVEQMYELLKIKTDYFSEAEEFPIEGKVEETEYF